MNSTPVPYLLAGAIRPINENGLLSSIGKRPLTGPWIITEAGVSGDAQADLRHHGGREKALHHYPLDHHSRWISEIGLHPLLGLPGAFGENIATMGWTEANVHVGDIVGFGSSVLQVSQGRQPCFKLNHRFAIPDMARRMQRNGMSGWYYRVLEPGRAEPGDEMDLRERVHEAWPIQRLTDLLYRNTQDVRGLSEMAELQALSASWRQLAERRLATRRTEDWEARLFGRVGQSGNNAAQVGASEDIGRSAKHLIDA